MRLHQELAKYDLSRDVLSETKEKEREGWVFVASEENLNELGQRTGLVDIAGQCALGNVGTVLMGEIDATLRKSSEPVTLTLYFVEHGQYQAACQERRSNQL